MSTPTATMSATYQRTPVTHRLTTQPRFGSPTFRYAHTYVSTATVTAMTVTPTMVTPVPTPIKAEMARGDSFDIEDGMVTISYTRSAANPSQWEPVKITMNEFKERFVDKQKGIKKRVTFEGERTEETATKKIKFTEEEEELMRKIEDWATANKRLTGGTKYGDDDDDSDREKTGTTKRLRKGKW